MNLISGRTWAYIGLVVGLALSVAGNISSVLLRPETGVSDWLSVTLASIWSLLTYIGIEVLIRTRWDQHWTHWLTRLVLMGPVSLVAAIVSYLHLHDLMVMTGEPGLAQAIGPLAIDGLLFGCTVALLITSQHRAETRRTLAASVRSARDGMADLRSAIRGTEVPALPATDIPALLATEVPEDIRPVSPPRVPQPRTRGTWDQVRAIQMLMDPDCGTDAEIGATVGIGPKVIQRTRRAVIALRQDPRAEVPAAWKVPAATVQLIRAEVQR